jgi:hypothetical protein
MPMYKEYKDYKKRLSELVEKIKLDHCFFLISRWLYKERKMGKRYEIIYSKKIGKNSYDEKLKEFVKGMPSPLKDNVPGFTELMVEHRKLFLIKIKKNKKNIYRWTISINKNIGDKKVFNKEEFIKKFIKDSYKNYFFRYLKKISDHLINNNYINEMYVTGIEGPMPTDKIIGAFSFGSISPLRDEKIISILRTTIKGVMSDYHLREMNQLRRNHALRSAVAAIMTRNMSHNIGSHVLSRLVSHGINGWTKGKGVAEIINSICQDNREEKTKGLVYWAKDVQNLLKYLQQRQDFLAVISTEWPEWTDVAYFMQDIMRWFFYQKQILDNIAASEGLSDHNYEKENNKDIRFHIFLIPEELWGEQANSVVDRFKKIKVNCKSLKGKDGKLGCNTNNNNCPSCRRVLLYTDNKKGSGRLSDDIQVAVPGGVIGYQAFYVILENIIRNAAKHSFEGSGKRHLDVVIEILYDPEEKIGINIKGVKRPAYLFRIYNNVGNVRNGRILLWNKKAKGESKEGINDYLGTPLIDETGKLKKECWGMAEMKIAAGFLQGRDIEQIGAGGDKIYGPYGSDKNYNFLKLAETEKGSHYIIRAIESPLGTLGYEFYVRKPKMLGILCKKEGNENGTM